MSSARKPAAAGKTMSVVSVDHCSYALPLEDGQRVLALLAKAVRVDRDYRSQDLRRCYTVRRAPDLELEIAQPDQFRQAPPERDEAAPRTLALPGGRA